MGIMSLLSDVFSSEERKMKKLMKRKQLQTVEMKVKMDCEGCERRVKHAVDGLKGVTDVQIEPKKNKLTVVGYVDAEKVVKRVRRKTGKKVKLWPYVPYDEVAHPYTPGSYDKKAPPGYVRNASENPNAAALARASTEEERFTSAFSDENPNSCIVM